MSSGEMGILMISKLTLNTDVIEKIQYHDDVTKILHESKILQSNVTSAN